jgi:hypothetical protein
VEIFAMRWLYYDKSNRSEAAEHDRMSNKIDEWWAEFRRNTDRLDALFRQVEQWDLPGWMDRHLQDIDPRLMWEFGPAINKDGHRLVITPENESELRPLVDEIVARAPQLDRWEFYTYRLPENMEQTLATVDARTDMNLEDVTVALAVGEHNRIDLTYRWNRLPADDDQTFNAAFVATEILLGEKHLDRWVGVIQLVDNSTPPETGQRFLPLDRLKPTFDSLVDTTQAQLPREPYSAFIDDSQWAALKLEPAEAQDYPDRYDLLTSITCNPDLIAATFSDAPFFSERYSRCRETFCYVKIDGVNATEMGFQDREDMEEAARHALEAQDSGAVIGGGTGLRYSYIELALTDTTRGINAIRRAMQEGNVPRRSWILFHDTDYAAEWIGIYDDSPAPPMEKVES